MNRTVIITIARDIAAMEARNDVGQGRYTQAIQQLKGELTVWGRGPRPLYLTAQGRRVGDFARALSTWQAA